MTCDDGNVFSPEIPLPADPRLFASDLDGTLLLPDGSVGARTRIALDRLAESDLDFVIVTGRPPRWLRPVADATGHLGTAIAANGAAIIDLATSTVTDTLPIPTDMSLKAIEHLKEAVPGIVFAVEKCHPGAVLADVKGSSYQDLDATELNPDEFALGIDYTPRWTPPPGTIIAPIEELVEANDVIKIVARQGPHSSMSADEFLATAFAALGGTLNATHSGLDDILLECSAPWVSKATTLERFAADHKYSAAQVLTAGDAPNDLPMLHWAEYSYAVANAHPAVRDAATAVIPSNADEGVATLLDSLIKR